MEAFDGYYITAFNVGETRSKPEIEEADIYKKLTESFILSFPNAFTQIRFSPIQSHSICGISGLSGFWIDGNTLTHTFSFAKTKSIYTTFDIRADGVLIVFGNEQGNLNIFPIDSHQTLLRRFKARLGPISSVKFSPFKNEIFAGTEDGHIFVVDISSNNFVFKIKAYDDSVCGIVHLNAGNIWISASKNGSIKMWDMNNGVEISSISISVSISGCIIAGDRIYISSGEEIIVLSVHRTISVVYRWTAHTRPIVGLQIARGNLVTVGADQQLRVFDPSSFQKIYSQSVHYPVTSFDILPDCSSIVFAFSSGTVQIKSASAEIEIQPVSNLPMKQRPKIDPCNKCLKNYEFDNALDLALQSNNPNMVIAMIDELDNIGGLERALSGRTITQLKSILDFIRTQLINPIWSHIVFRALIVILKVYRQYVSEVPAFSSSFEDISEIVKEELQTQKHASFLIGKINFLIQ